MKLLFDFLPIAIFFGVYKYTGDIIIATAVLIPATIVQMLVTWLRTHKIEKMQLVTLALVVVLGGATVLLQDKTFIQWKPTVVNWLFAVAFLGSQFIGAKTLVQRMMESAVELPAPIWVRLNLAWVVFFIIMGGLNLFVAFTMSEETWVNFKLFGMLGLTLVFIILQGIYLSKHMPESTPDEDDGIKENSSESSTSAPDK
ncbi:MAG: septation protein A [Motiliproteus sp.]